MEFAAVASIEEILRSFYSTAANVLGSTWTTLGAFAQHLKTTYPKVYDNLTPQNVAAAASVTFAAWRWWVSREKTLFGKFERMIERDERKLVGARSSVLDALVRPGPGVRPDMPTFINKDLLRVLKKKRLVPWLAPPGRKNEAVISLIDKTVESLDRQISSLSSRRQLAYSQQATAYLIQGAVTAAQAEKTSDKAEVQHLNHRALDHYQRVLSLPGHEADIDAFEMIARQQYKIEGATQTVAQAWQRLIEGLLDTPSNPQRDLRLARAKLHLAHVQFQMGNPGNARSSLKSGAAGASATNGSNATELGAIDLFKLSHPLSYRDRADEARALRLLAEVQFRLNAHVRGREALDAAIGRYNDLLASLEERQQGLFGWTREQRYSNHRIKELHRQIAAERKELDLLRQKMTQTSAATAPGEPTPQPLTPT